MTPFWARSNLSKNELLEVVAITRSGRKLMSEFRALPQAWRPKFLHLSEAQIADRYQLPQTSGAPSAFTLRVEYGQIKAELALDFDLELGLLLPVLVHELTHATDLNYRQSMVEVYRRWDAFYCSRDEVLKNKVFTPSALGELTQSLDLIRQLEAQCLVESEERAYAAQVTWIEEVGSKNGGYFDYLDSAVAHGYRLRFTPQSEQLRAHANQMRKVNAR
jgi:hypothetical protein